MPLFTRGDSFYTSLSPTTPSPNFFQLSLPPLTSVSLVFLSSVVFSLPHLMIIIVILGMDRPGARQVPEGSGEQVKMEKTGCKIICGAPTTLAVKGLMMMMMYTGIVNVSTVVENKFTNRVTERENNNNKTVQSSRCSQKALLSCLETVL